jgi:hypothetical protein
MRQDFYNTVQAQGTDLMKFKASAKSQEQSVLELFQRLQKPMAWSEVKACIGFEIDDCSLKRCLTNLATDKRDKRTGEVIDPAILVKTKELVTGPKGKPCHRYKLI